MIKVECVSCKSPYDVDERRIPDKGMKMRCPKCSTSFMVARDGSTSEVAQPAARPPLAPPVLQSPLAPPPTAADVPGLPSGGAAARNVAGADPTEPISPPLSAASLLTPAPGAVPAPPAAAQPNLGQAPSAFNRTLMGGSSKATEPKASPLGTMLNFGAKPAAGAAPSVPRADAEADLPAVKPAPRPAVPWGSLAPPAPDAKPPVRPGPGAGLPKGAIGASSGTAGQHAPLLQGAGAGSGVAGSPQRTLLGPARVQTAALGAAAEQSVSPAAADLADLPAPRGQARPGDLPLVDLPAAKPSSDNAAHKRKPIAPELPLVDLPAAKAKSATLIGQQDAHKPANTVEPDDLGQAIDDALIDLPAPRPAAAGFAAKGPEKPRAARPPIAPSVEPPVVDLPAPAGAGASSQQSGKMPGFGQAGRAQTPELPLEVDLPAPAASAAQRGPIYAKPGPAQDGRSFGTAATLVGHSDQAASVDLPAPRQEVDLPAPKPGATRPMRQPEVDLPASKADIDLPARKNTVALPASKLDVDLPAPKVEADLPAALGGLDLPAPKSARGDVDLPAALGDMDLPTPRDGVDLPTPRGSADLPAPRGAVDLPTPKGLLDLPSPAGAADLPTPKGVTDLPVPRGEEGFGMLDLPIPKSEDEASFGDLEMPDLPVRAGFGDVELPVPQRFADRDSASGTQSDGFLGLDSDEASFGDLDLGGPELSEESFADLQPDDLVQLKQGAVPAQPEPSEHGGQDGLGGLDGEAYGEAGLLDDSEEDMEFGIAEGDESLGLPPELLRRNKKGEATNAEDAARGKRALRILVGVVAALFVVGGAGAALALTDYGFFGIYYWEQFLPEAADPRFAQEAIARAEKTASTDTYRDVQRSLALLGESRHKAGLNRELLTRSLLHESLFSLRFGTHAASAAHAASILKRLEERHGRAPGMALGRAADAARRGESQQAQTLLDGARAEARGDAYFSLLEGELALQASKLAEADKAFSQALKDGGAARAQWGLARVALARTDVGMRRSAVEETLKLSPMHAEARLAFARLLWNEGKQAQALSELHRALGQEPVGGQYIWSSKAAKAGGYSLLGYVHESRGHLSQARKAYDEALAADPYLLEALLGAGRVLLRERRWNDALARFESALSLAQKSGAVVVLGGRRADVEARLGQSRAQLSLNRAPEARETLAELMKDNPNDAEIVQAAGEAEDIVGDHTAAEQLLIKSVELAPTTFSSYLALAQHYFRQSQADKASETLNEAASKVEENVQMRRMLGQSELARSRFDSAAHEFKRAIELDPQDLEAQFGLATAYRRLGQIDEARVLLDGIAKRDPQFAGLALERGQLLEAEGEYEQAVQTYRAAHAKDPSDGALNLRLGAAQVEAGHLEDAELTLQTVMRETPNSPEAEYVSGRLALARGRGPDALTHFDRALSLDGTQAIYHLYAARAALDMSNLSRTLDEAEATIARDPAMGDAYWVRGIVRLRSGAVKDALKDAKRTLDLNPARHDAYALMAECFDELRQLAEAARTYRIALSKVPDRAEWWYKLGRLSMDRGARKDAHEALAKARTLGDALDPAPYWLSDAYRLSGELARHEGDRKQAVELFKRYLAIAPDGAIDRDDVRKLLLSWDIELNP